jgi:formyl-CoA transferase
MTVRRREYNPEAHGPLRGVKIVDLSRLVCGNTLTQLLGDYGADVIKVEPPQGDTLRAWRMNGIEAHWKNLARNKKSLALNFRTPQAINLIKQLAANAAVLVESFRPGTLEDMGLGPDVLLSINPKLVVVRISGWGQSGPYRERPGFGSLVEGMSGLAALSGFADREPLLPPFALADAVAGYAGAMSTLIALRHAEASGGKGQVIDLPLFDPLFSILGPEAAHYQLSGKIKQRAGSRSSNAAPRNVYRTKDGRWIALSASIQQMAMRLFVAIGRPELCEDPRFKTNAARVANVDALDQIIGAFIAQKTQAANLEFFEAAEITIGPIYDIGQIVDDPHFQERETIVELPDGDVGQFAMNGIVPRMLGTPGEFFGPAPKLGEHNHEVLEGLGLDAASIEGLYDAGVIMCADAERKKAS